MARALSVISGKGGTGKTSLCAAIAVCLASEGKRVLCIDLDVGLRNLDISLGMADCPVLPFTSVMRGEYPLSQAAKHPLFDGVSLLTAPITERAEDLEEAQLQALLNQARSSFDWILMDAPAGVGTMFQLAAACSDEALVVSLADPASQRDAARAADLLFERRDIPVRLVVNRVSPRMFSKMNYTVDDVMDSVGLPLIGIVPDDPSVTLAAAAGLPLVRYTSEGASVAASHIAKRLCAQRVALMKLR